MPVVTEIAPEIYRICTYVCLPTSGTPSHP